MLVVAIVGEVVGMVVMIGIVRVVGGAFSCYWRLCCLWCRRLCAVFVLLRYPRTCLGIRSLGVLFVFWCF